MARAAQADWEAYHDAVSFGDPDARELSAMWSSFCHALDDVIDGEALDTEGFSAEMVRALGAFSFNPFYQKHKHELWGLIVQSISYYMESDRWRYSQNPDEVKHANAMRAFYDCVNYQIGYIASGYSFEKMRVLTKQWRDFIWKDVNADGVGVVDEPWRAK